MAILWTGAAVATAAPTNWIQSVTHSGETITLQMARQDLRGANFEVLLHTSAGTYVPYVPPGERSYLGTVDEYPDAVASGILKDDGQFSGAVYFDRGVTWFTLGNQVYATKGLDYARSTFDDFEFSSIPSVLAGNAGTDTYGFDVGLDARYEYFSQRAGSDAAATFEQIELSVALVRPIYLANALLRPYLGRIIIRTSQAQDPFNGLTGTAYLDALKAHWNLYEADANRDAVAGIAGSSVGGGWAFIGTMGTSSAYSVNDSDADGGFHVIWRHELGHNWGCGHYVGGSPEGKGIMGGNTPARFTGCEVYKILNHRNERVATGGILENEGTYSAVNLPPYAALDMATVAVGGTYAVDVLANDFDANAHALNLTTNFDAITDQGGRVTLSVGTRPGSRDQLLYSPPGTLGFDGFSYEIVDSSGQTASGRVHLMVELPSQIHEAEYAASSGAVFKSENDGYTGTGYADYQNAGNDYVQWTFNVPATRDYDLAFRYALDGAATNARPLQIQVDGVTVATNTFPSTGSWITWQNTVNLRTYLSAGFHTVRATAIGLSGANVDHLKVYDITDTSDPQDPYFHDHPLIKPCAQIGRTYYDTLADVASDPDLGDVLTFGTVSDGPAWLTVHSDGTLSGTPAVTDEGTNTWEVSVTDSKGASDTGTLTILVEQSGPLLTNTLNNLSWLDAIWGSPATIPASGNHYVITVTGDHRVRVTTAGSTSSSDSNDFPGNSITVLSAAQMLIKTSDGHTASVAGGSGQLTLDGGELKHGPDGGFGAATLDVNQFEVTPREGARITLTTAGKYLTIDGTLTGPGDLLITDSEFDDTNRFVSFTAVKGYTGNLTVYEEVGLDFGSDATLAGTLTLGSLAWLNVDQTITIGAGNLVADGVVIPAGVYSGASLDALGPNFRNQGGTLIVMTPVVAAPRAVWSGFSAGQFRITYINLDTNETYTMHRGSDTTSFSIPVDTHRPTTTTDFFTDPIPPPDEAYYRLILP